MFKLTLSCTDILLSYVDIIHKPRYLSRTWLRWVVTMIITNSVSVHSEKLETVQTVAGLDIALTTNPLATS